MKKKQVLTLSAIALVLGSTLLIVKQTQKNFDPPTLTSRAAGDRLFASFPATEISQIEIIGAEGNVTLVKKDSKWTVAQRENYPANAVNVNEFIRTLAELKVTRSLEAAPSFAPRFGMDESASKPEDRGITAIFSDENGKELAKVSLGKSIEGPQDASPMGPMPVGRYIRNHADESGFYAVNEMFFSVSPDVTRWLAEEFVVPEKIKSVSLSQKGSDIVAWKLARETENAEFKLEGLKAGEELDSDNVAPIKNLFSYARFEDVVTNSAAAERADVTGKRIASIETFDGFTYKLTITPPKSGSNPSGVAADNLLVTVHVDANLPTQRNKAENEKPGDAKAKDEEFAKQLQALNEKLAREQSLVGRTFEFSKNTLDAFLKDRDSLLKKDKNDEAASTPNPLAQPAGPNSTKGTNGLSTKKPPKREKR